MADARDHKELVTVEGIATSNMWEIAGLVEVLEKKSVLTRQEIYEAITDP